MIIVLTSFTMKTHRHLIFNNNNYNYNNNMYNYNYVPTHHSFNMIRQLEKQHEQDQQLSHEQQLPPTSPSQRARKKNKEKKRMDLIDYLLHAEQEEEEEQLQRQQDDGMAIDSTSMSTTTNATIHDRAQPKPYENLKLAICHRTMFNGNIPLNFDRIKGMDIIS